MPITDSTARPNAVEDFRSGRTVHNDPGEPRLWTGGNPCVHTRRRALSLPGPRPIPITSRLEKLRFGVSLMSISVVVICPGRPQRGKVTALSALRHLLAILRAAGRIPPATVELSGFHHLRTARLL